MFKKVRKIFFLSLYNLRYPKSKELLDEAVGNLTKAPDDYLEEDFRRNCEDIIPVTISNNEIVDAFIHLKTCL